MSDILKTLNERERSVAEFLLSQPGHKARQNRVRHACKIPKTSFFRVLRSLEKKGVTSAEKFLNTKELALSGWFLGK